MVVNFYALMMKEAEQWFVDHQAYGEDWDTLPQEIKDALYVTYSNLGRAAMEQLYQDGTAKGTIPF